MLERAQSKPAAPAPETTIGLRTILSFLRRKRSTIVAGGLLFLAAGIGYLVVAPPVYTATADILIDTRKLQVFGETSMYSSDAQINTGVMESHLQIITSDKVVGAAVDNLKLTEDADFMQPSMLSVVKGWIKGLLATFGAGGGDGDPETPRQLAIEKVQQNLNADRIGLSYAMQVSYDDPGPKRSARIAQGIADAYIQDQLTTASNATELASNWLGKHLVELRTNATNAEQALQKFRIDNKLIETGPANGGATRLISEQQVSEHITQLTAARSKTSEVRSRLAQIKAVLANPDVTGLVGDFTNDNIEALRREFLNDAKQKADFSARYGPTHGSVTDLQSKMDNIQATIKQELQRVANGIESEFSVAQAHEQEVQKSLDDYLAEASKVSLASVDLKDLESTATANRTLYDTFLQRYMQSVAQQSFHSTEARVITPASVPTQKSKPKTALTLVASLILGLGAGVGFGLMRELLDGTVKTVRQAEMLADAPFLGAVPLASKARLRQRRGRDAPAAEGERVITTFAPIHSAVLNEPMSQFAETIRSTKVAVDNAAVGQKGRVVGVISAQPLEGKSTTAVNLARQMAKGGKRTLLIDGDLRNPSLTAALAPSLAGGLVEVLSGDMALSAALWRDPATGLDMLPATHRGGIDSTSDILGSVAMADLIAELRGRYDYIVVDFAPVLSSVDVRACARVMDMFVLVVNWGETRLDAVADTVRQSAAIRERVIGVILNKVNMAVMRSFEHVPDVYY